MEGTPVDVGSRFLKLNCWKEACSPGLRFGLQGI